VASAIWRDGQRLSVARLTVEDAEELRELRREALLAHPTAFSADPEIEAKMTIETWRERLRSGRWFGGKIDRTLVGMASFWFEPSRKIRHTARVGSMYVRESARGSGMAGALLEAVLAEAAKRCEQATLSVEASNARAIRLYERHGFRLIGRFPRALLIDGSYYDELEMYRMLSQDN
jgi:RimJ/RimL family protein N-acetyltransferase